MKTFKYRGYVISFRINEEPAGVFWPSGNIEDPATGETSPVSLPFRADSEIEAATMVAREAAHRIVNGTAFG